MRDLLDACAEGGDDATDLGGGEPGFPERRDRFGSGSERGITEITCLWTRSPCVATTPCNIRVRTRLNERCSVRCSPNQKIGVRFANFFVERAWRLRSLIQSSLIALAGRIQLHLTTDLACNLNRSSNDGNSRHLLIIGRALAGSADSTAIPSLPHVTHYFELHTSGSQMSFTFFMPIKSCVTCDESSEKDFTDPTQLLVILGFFRFLPT